MSGRNSKLGASALLVSPSSVLSEASAYRITPTFVYVYKYKNNVKAQGLVPVRIKHANVEKYWDDLVDPEPGDPLNNLVIGTLPKSYNDPSDLQLKDKKKKLKDVMTKDGAAGAKDAEAKGVPASALAPQMLVTGDALNIAVALGYKPESKEAEMLGTLEDNEGNLALSAETYLVEAGQKKLKPSLEAVTAEMSALLELAFKAKYIDADEDPDDSENFIATFLGTAPAYTPPAKPVATPTPAPTPASADFAKVAAELKKKFRALPSATDAQPLIPKKGGADILSLTPSNVQALSPNEPIDADSLSKAIQIQKANYEKAGEKDSLAYVKSALLSAVATGKVNVIPTLAAAGFTPDAVKGLFKDVLSDVKHVYELEKLEAALTEPEPAPAPAPAKELSPSEKIAAIASNLSAKAKSSSATDYSADGKTVSFAANTLKDMGLKQPTEVVGAALVAAYDKVLKSYPDTALSQYKLAALKGLAAGHAPGAVMAAFTSAGVSEDNAFSIISGVVETLKTKYNTQVAAMAAAATASGVWSAKIEADFAQMMKDAPVMPGAETFSTTIGDITLSPTILGVLSDEGPLDPEAAARAAQRLQSVYALAAMQNPGSDAKIMGEILAAILKGKGATAENLVAAAAANNATVPMSTTIKMFGAIVDKWQEFYKEEQAKKTSTAAAGVIATPIAAGPMGSLSVPPLDTLSIVGDAKGVLKGAHPKKFLKDGEGNDYLFKPSESAKTAHAGALYATLAAKVLGADKVVPVVAGTVPGAGFGSVQPMVPNVKATLADIDLKTLSPAQLDSLLRERVMDWALSSHDAKPGNFLMLDSGQIVGIDKEQALKNIGADKLATTYNPNPTKQIYSTLFDMYADKKIKLNPYAMLGPIKAIEAISDAEWLALAAPYIQSAEPGLSAQNELKKKILARKKNIRSDIEGFISGLLKKRGELQPDDTFLFKEDEAEEKEDKPTASIGGVSLPPLESLKPMGKADKIGGAGEKYFYQDAKGQKWLLKIAATKPEQGEPKRAQPGRVAAQEIFSEISNIVRPGKSQPVGKSSDFEGFPTTLQPWLDLDKAKPTLEGTAPSELTDSEKKDVAEEHLLDWMLSQHDTHAKNLVRRADGTILSIDKEQGFKYFTGTFRYKDGTLAPEDVKLSTDYHPNKPYFEDEPYYNQFWRAFGDGSMDFDPTVLADALKRVESISEGNYTKLLGKYTEHARFKNDPVALNAFLQKAQARKANLRAEFEEFITGLYRKRKKKKTGSFTFAGGWVDGGKAKAKAPAPAPVGTPAPKKSKTVPAMGGAIFAAEAKKSVPAKNADALKAVEAFAAELGKDTPNLAGSPVWAELADSMGPSAFADMMQSEVSKFVDLPPAALKKRLEEEAAAAYPADPMLRNMAVQDALNRKVRSKRTLEVVLSQLLASKLGEEGAFTFKKGWVQKAAAPKPKIKKVKVSPAEAAKDVIAAQGVVIEQSFNNDTSLVALKIKGTDWKAKQQAFEAATGLQATGPAKEKKSESSGVKVFIPYSKAAFNEPTIEKEIVEMPPVAGTKEPSPSTPEYLPPVAPATPYQQTFADIDSAPSMQMGASGVSFPTDGLGVENNEITVRPVFDKQNGRMVHVVNFKLRPELWASLATKGAPSEYKFFQGPYDPAAGHLVGEGRSGGAIRSRAVSDGASTLHYLMGSTNPTYNPNSPYKLGSYGGVPPKYDTKNMAVMGQIQLEVALGPNEKLTDKMKLLLDKLEPGLGDKVFKEPTAEEKEIGRLMRVLWATNPQIADNLKDEERTLENLKGLMKKHKVPAEYQNAQETELFPGYKSLVVPGRWKRPEMLLPDGTPKVRMIQVGSKTASTLVRTLTSAAGPICQMERLQQGVGNGSGQSESSDQTSGGAEQSMWRICTAGTKAASPISAKMNTGSACGPYRSIIPPDELDRLDTILYKDDSFGNLGGQYDTLSFFVDRKPLADAVDTDIANPKPSAEVDFRKGVSNQRVVRVVCTAEGGATAEQMRQRVLDEAKKQGVTEIRGVPIEDFFIADNGDSMETIYQRYIRPLGY